MDTTSAKAVAARATAVGIAQAALWAVLCAALLRVFPTFEQIFRDFACQLPQETELVLMSSHVISDLWYLAILAICLWPVVNRHVVSTLWSNPESVVARRLWYWITWLVPIVLLTFVVGSIVASVRALISQLSSG